MKLVWQEIHIGCEYLLLQRMRMHLSSPALHFYPLNRDVSDFLCRFCQANRAVIVVLSTECLEYVFVTGLTVCALVLRVLVRQQQQLPCAFLIRTDCVVLAPEFHDLTVELRVRHALSTHETIKKR